MAPLVPRLAPGPPHLRKHLCTPLTAPLQMRAAEIFSKQASRAANTDWSAEGRAAARAAEAEAVAAARQKVAPPLTAATLRSLPPRVPPPNGLSSRDTSACGLLSALPRGARGGMDAAVSARGSPPAALGLERALSPASHRCNGACVAARSLRCRTPPALAATCDHMLPPRPPRPRGGTPRRTRRRAERARIDSAARGAGAPPGLPGRPAGRPAGRPVGRRPLLLPRCASWVWATSRRTRSLRSRCIGPARRRRLGSAAATQPRACVDTGRSTQAAARPARPARPGRASVGQAGVGPALPVSDTAPGLLGLLGLGLLAWGLLAQGARS